MRTAARRSAGTGKRSSRHGQGGLVGVEVPGPDVAPLALDHDLGLVARLVLVDVGLTRVDPGRPAMLAPVGSGLAELAEGRRVATSLRQDVAPVSERAVAIGQALVVGPGLGGELLGGLD